MATRLRDEVRRLRPREAGEVSALLATAVPTLALLVTVVALATDREMSETPSEPPPAPIRLEPEALVSAVLDRYHGPLRGKFDTAIVQLREHEDAKPTQALIARPGRLRVDRADGRVDLLIKGTGWRCTRGRAAAALEGDELQQLQQLRHGLRALMLIPLYEAEQVRRAGPGVISLILAGGETWRLELTEETLELVELSGPPGAVRYLSFLDTGLTKHPSVVEMAGIGRRHVQFLTAGLYLDEALFEDPFLEVQREPVRPSRETTKSLTNPAELPTAPELQDVERRTFLVLGEPGTWPERFARLGSAAQILTEQGQMANGLPTYRLVGDVVDLMIPFRPNVQTNQPFIPRPDQETLRLPSHRAVVVAPPPGTWDEVLERGRGMVEAFLAKEGLQADGALLCIPFLRPGRLPTPSDLASMQIRLEQPVAR